MFRPAVRENVGLLIGLAGGTGSGKTFSAMRLASGIAGTQRFCVIDTEAGRAKHYADQFKFDHGDLAPPFSPARYAEAIAAADEAGYPAIVVDSVSHEHAGEGGLLDMFEEEFERMGRRDAVKMTAWIKPKGAHKKMVSRLLQVRAHLILCFRAEEKVDIVTVVEDGKKRTKIVPKVTRTGLEGWTPIAEKNLPYELTASFLLTADAPGIPKPIKLQQQHRALFPLDQPITEESGRRLAQWASGAPKAEGRASTGSVVQAPSGGQPQEAPVSSATKAEAQAPVSASAGSDLPLDQPSPPASSAPDDPFLSDPEPLVDTDTGEVKSRGRIPAFVVPNAPPTACTSADEWFGHWTTWMDRIAASHTLDMMAKVEKIWALKKANETAARSMGGRFVAKVNADAAARAKAIRDAEVTAEVTHEKE
jgi:hypothetical protein